MLNFRNVQLIRKKWHLDFEAGVETSQERKGQQGLHIFTGMVCPQASHRPKHISRVSASKVLPTTEEEIKEQLSQLEICPFSQMVCTQE